MDENQLSQKHLLLPIEQQEESKRRKLIDPQKPLFSDLDDDQLTAIFGESLRFVLCQLVLAKGRYSHLNPQKLFGTIQAAAGGFSLDPLLQQNRFIFNRKFNNPVHISLWPNQVLHDDICYCSLPVSPTSVVQIAAKLYIITDKLDDVAEYPPDDEPVPPKREPVTDKEELDKLEEFLRQFDSLSPAPRSTPKQIAEPTIPIPNEEVFIIYNEAFHVCHDNTSIKISDKPNGGAGCSKLHGEDGILHLRYVVFKYAIDAELEVEFLTDEHTQVTGSIRAYYGEGFNYDDNGNPTSDYYVWLLHPPHSNKVYHNEPPIAYVKPGRVNLYRSVLPVPANSSLIIEAKLHQGEDVILSGSLEFPVPFDYCSSYETIQGDGCSLKLKVNWKLPPSEEPKIRSSSNSSFVTCHRTERRRKLGAKSTSTMADPVKYNRWSVRGEIAKAFNTSLKRTFKLRKDVSCTISTCTKEDGGDYLCSTVLDIWPRQRKIHLYKGPKHAGLAVKDNIMGSGYKNMLETCVVCGPGFVKFKLCKKWIAKSIRTMLRVGIQTWAPKFPVKKAIIYLFPQNIATEEVHMDHIRSTYFGETLARMLEYSGVVLLGGIYDHGFAHIIESWHDVHTYYEAVELKLREHRQRMDSVNETIRGSYKTLYHLLGIDVKKEDESFYESYTREILLQLEEDLHIGIEKDVLLAHLLSLGHTLKEEKADWIVHVSDVGKRVYIEMCITAAERVGLIANDHSECPLSHLGFGLVQGDDFERFRNCNANLDNLVGEVQSRCKALLERQDMAKLWFDKELGFEPAAKALGSGAYKYEELKYNRLTNYTLSFDQMLNEEGNTAVYLQLTHARICSIVKNSSKDIMELTDEVLMLKHDDERELGLHLLRFTEVIEEVCTILAPHILCDYLYGLCNQFNRLKSSVWQVVGSCEEASKLLLCVATEVVMRKCFHFLGITPITSHYISILDAAECQHISSLESEMEYEGDIHDVEVEAGMEISLSDEEIALDEPSREAICLSGKDTPHLNRKVNFSDKLQSCSMLNSKVSIK